MSEQAASSNGNDTGNDIGGSDIRAITVYCASSGAVATTYMDLAARVGTEMARRGLELVFGGGSVGMMGVLADAALAAGGKVHGVITRQLQGLEVAHPSLTTLEVVESMHERKLAMTKLGDAFFVLPGGFGTLDEAIEAITWKQLGIHERPIVLLNHKGYFDTLLRFFDEAIEKRFVHEQNRDLFEVVADVDEAFEALKRARPPGAIQNPLWAPRP